MHDIIICMCFGSWGLLIIRSYRYTDFVCVCVCVSIIPAFMHGVQ